MMPKDDLQVNSCAVSFGLSTWHLQLEVATTKASACGHVREILVVSLSAGLLMICTSTTAHRKVEDT